MEESQEREHIVENEVEEKREDNSSDEGVVCSGVTLHYSREDIQILAQQAELMVLGKIEPKLEEDEEEEIVKKNEKQEEEEDSDYSSHLLLSSSLVSSEPNLQRRSSPHRRTLHRRQT